MVIPCVHAKAINVKTTPASIENNFTWLFAINASLSIIFDAKIFLKSEILCLMAKKFLLTYLTKIF